MHKKNLIIIGNGFDLAHGLETRWSNFKEYLSLFNEELLHYLEQCAENDLWSDFEKGLGKLNRKKIYANELSDFDCIKNDDDDGRNHQMADRIRNVEDLIIDDTKRTLNNWILSIDVNVTPFENLKQILNGALVITFNYTQTLEMTYGLNSSNIVYLHGKAESIPSRTKDDYFAPDPVPDIVIGHGEDVTPVDVGSFANGMSDEIVLDEVEIEGHRDILIELKKDTSRYMHRIDYILNSMDSFDNIYIIGHSLSPIDAPYFNAIASCTNAKTHIYVTYCPELENKQKKESKVKQFFHSNLITVKEIEEL